MLTDAGPCGHVDYVNLNELVSELSSDELAEMVSLGASGHGEVDDLSSSPTQSASSSLLGEPVSASQSSLPSKFQIHQPHAE